MIHVFPVGRLGNQMFQYAFARILQINNPSQAITWHWDILTKYGNENDGWRNDLKFFNTKDVDCADSSISLTLFQKIVYRLYWYFAPQPNASLSEKAKYQNRFEPIISNCGFYYFGLAYYPYKFKHKKGIDIVVSGSFEIVRHLEKYKSVFVKEFTPKYPLQSCNWALYEKITSTESVCVSIRRGDFMLSKNSMHNVCSQSYFENAINKALLKIPNATLFFFSDDIEWVKNNVKIGKNIQCYYESGRDPVWEKMRLMYSCKHFIISNSTFSWWAQFLGRNENKMVFAPKRWYNDEFVPLIYQNEWILIDVKKNEY